MIERVGLVREPVQVGVHSLIALVPLRQSKIEQGLTAQVTQFWSRLEQTFGIPLQNSFFFPAAVILPWLCYLFIYQDVGVILPNHEDDALCLSEFRVVNERQALGSVLREGLVIDQRREMSLFALELDHNELVALFTG